MVESLLRLPLPESWVVSLLSSCYTLYCVSHLLRDRPNFQVTKLHELIDNVTSSYDKFFFNDVGREIYDFFWGDFADWYRDS